MEQRKYTEHVNPSFMILQEVFIKGKSEGWAGSTAIVDVVKETLAPYNVYYADDFTGTWKLKEQKDAKSELLKALGKIKLSNEDITKFGDGFEKAMEKAIEEVKRILPAKKKFVLFMSHDSGEHGLTIHNTLEEVKEEVKSVVETIKSNKGDDEADYEADLAIVEQITGDGDYFELSDSTWFDVFEVEI